jgi:DnaJ-class molecular chaperone
MCLWAANNGKLVINTPTLKVIKFLIDGFEKADKKKLADKDETELKKLKLVTEKASKSGKKSELNFEKVATASNEDSVIAEDLYKVLDVAEDADQSTIKSKFRRASITNHPDKGGDPKVFNMIREANEILGDPENRRYYDMGGAQLVKNVENLNKEAEGQKAQLEAQLGQVPKNHPQRAMFEAQIAQQKRQFDKSNMKHEIEKKLRAEDMDVFVPISAQELYNGVSKKEFEFKRLVICRGCRADPTSAACQACGRCPPEKVQVPKYGMTPFGRQVVGVKEKEQESSEKCREQPMKLEIRVPKGAKEGSTLKSAPDIGHQTPGKIPGRLVLKVLALTNTA